MSYGLVVIFAEDPNDAQALEQLLHYLVPGTETVRRPRQPLVLIRGRPLPAARNNAERIAKAVQLEEFKAGKRADLVIAHQDCDDTEPAHVRHACDIEGELSRCGIRKPVAAVPA